MVGVGGAASSSRRRRAYRRHARRLAERILPRADLGEHADAVGELAVGMRRGRGPDRRLSRAQKRIGRALVADRRRQRRLAPRALSLWPRSRVRAVRHCPVRPPARSEGSQACIRVRSRRAYCAGSAASLSSESTISVGVPSNSRPQPTANSVSPQKTSGAAPDRPTYAIWPAVWPGISSTDSASPMPGNDDLVALAQRMRAPGNRLPRRSVDGHLPALEQRAVAADMIAVMMRADDRGELELLALEIVDHRRSVAGIDDGRGAAFAQQPDVVVGERGDGDNRRHGRIFESAGQRVNRHARGVVRHAARPVPARARAGVFRHDARRHLRLSRAADRPAGDARSCAHRASRRAGPSTSRSRRRCSPIRTGFRFAENSFDLIVLPHALEFTDDPHQLLREVYRVIRPEGQMVDRRIQSVLACSAPSAISAASRRCPGTATSSRCTG